ncbi:SGNH hydrolase-type esterase domain-containing protein [Xylogone sp. PMI_703]|nr:SGNH hydrolase-type esterase domain-containing protein [Xylogone sp. PMI_703]
MQLLRLAAGVAAVQTCAVQVLGAAAGLSADTPAFPIRETLVVTRDAQHGNAFICTGEECLALDSRSHQTPSSDFQRGRNHVQRAVSASTTSTSASLPSCTGSSSTSPPNFYLRALPLGASITFGTGSTDGNGYRENLRKQIVNAGGHVNYVGSKTNGNMSDNQVEATPGDRLDQIQVKARLSLQPFMPNLVIIHAGTNDCIQNFSTATAPERLGDLIDEVLGTVPGTVVLVSTLIPNKVASTEACIQVFNAALPSVVKERTDAGKPVYLVDMHSGIITTADLSDDTHPNDEGYVKMANIWYGGLQQIFARCWLTPPVDNGINDAASGGSSLRPSAWTAASIITAMFLSIFLNAL